jgi:DNA-directed RNA polymerase specialized sigma24 family protein
MLYDREMSVAEVAEFLGVEPQTIRSTKHNALERLRARYAGKGDAP